MSDSAPVDLRPHHDWQKLVLFVLAICGAAWAIVNQVFNVGKTAAAIDKIDHMESFSNQLGVDVTRTKIQVEMLGGGFQEFKADTHDQLREMNAQLRQLNITGHHR